MLSAGETPVVHRQFKIDNYKKKKLHMGVFVWLSLQRGPHQVEEDPTDGDGTLEAEREGSRIGG